MSTRPEQLELLRRWREHGDQRARGQLIMSVMPFVKALARREARRGRCVSAEDLAAGAALAVMQAIDLWDPLRGSLTTWIARPVMHELRRQRVINDGAVMFTVPEWRPKYRIVVLKARRSLSQGDDIDVAALRREHRFSSEHVVATLLQVGAMGGASLDDTVVKHGPNDSRPVTLHERIADEGLSSERVIADESVRRRVRELLDRVTLTTREKAILRLRLMADPENEWTLEQLGEMFGLTRERIRQIEARLVKKLQNVFAEFEPQRSA